MRTVTEDLNDPLQNRAIVLSLRTYLTMMEQNGKLGVDKTLQHIEKIAYLEDNSTKSFLALMRDDHGK